MDKSELARMNAELMTKLRGALRFAASHSALTSAEEQAILSALQPEADSRPVVTVPDERPRLAECLAHGLWAVSRLRLGLSAEYLPDSRTDFRRAAEQSLASSHD